MTNVRSIFLMLKNPFKLNVKNFDIFFQKKSFSHLRWFIFYVSLSLEFFVYGAEIYITFILNICCQEHHWRCRSLILKRLSNFYVDFFGENEEIWKSKIFTRDDDKFEKFVIRILFSKYFENCEYLNVCKVVNTFPKAISWIIFNVR